MIYKTYVPLYLSDTALFCFFAAMFYVVYFGAEVLRVIDFFRARNRRRNAVHAAEPKLSFPTHMKDLPFPTEECVRQSNYGWQSTNECGGLFHL